MRAVAGSVCAEVVWRLAVSDPVPRLLVVDEFQSVLAVPGGADVLMTIIKRARKARLGVMTVTGEVQEFLWGVHELGGAAGHPGRSLLQNSAVKVVFGSGLAARSPLVDALGLSEDVDSFLSGVMSGQSVLVTESGDVCSVESVVAEGEVEVLGGAGLS